MVDRKEFWTLPGQIATLTERASGAGARECLVGLVALGNQRGLNLTGSLTLDTKQPAAAAEAQAAIQQAVAKHEAAADAAEAGTAAPPPPVSSEGAGSAPVSEGGEATPAADMQMLQTAVDAAVDEAVGALKQRARDVAGRIQRNRGKAKLPALRPAAVAKRAVANALAAVASDGGSGGKSGAMGGGDKGGSKGGGKKKRKKKAKKSAKKAKAEATEAVLPGSRS